MNKSKYLEFEHLGPKPGCKTSIWIVKSKSNGATLGLIKWYGAWRGYVFFPAPDTLFNDGCLRDIANLIEEETKKHKE